MKRIPVSASRSYEVVIGSGLLDTLGEEIKRVCTAQKICIVSDHTVWPLYGPRTLQALEDSGFETVRYIIPAGEASKNGQEFLKLLNFLAQNHITRTDALVALGGGVVGDLAGFTAACYLRGIAYIQVPTTVLAAVDSSVGGKTAIDLPAGKNLAGAFYQPSLVLCDLDTLDSLPRDIFLDGCAEIIKYGVLFDPVLFSHLRQTGPQFSREYVISRCVELKQEVVSQDEFDRGERQKLNLGHTIGHAVEAESKFSLSHGKSVAIGMAIVTRAAVCAGLCAPDTRQAILEVLEQFSLPAGSPYPAEALYPHTLSDKKRSAALVNLIVPQQIGNCVILPTALDRLKSFIEAGM